MTASQNRYERALNNAFLSEDNGADAFLDPRNICKRTFSFGDDLIGVDGFGRNNNTDKNLAKISAPACDRLNHYIY